jgi:O-methyltransferase
MKNYLVKARKKYHDPLFRFEILRRIAKHIVPEYRFIWPQMAWWNDAYFNDFLRKFNEIDGMNTDRRWTLYQLMRLVANIPGDTAEIGCYRGADSYIMCQMNKKDQHFAKRHYMFDSFEGLSDPLECDGKHWTKGDLACELEEVKALFKEFENVEIIKGWVPESFPRVDNLKFSFVHIDVDLYQPTLDSIKYFYPKMNQGGIILCDDYGFTSCPGATKAIDEFLDGKPEKMLFNSCGGGFLIKEVETSSLLPG